MGKARKAHAAGDLWHLSIDDLLLPPGESPQPAGPGPFVINLSTSTAPIPAPPARMPRFEGMRVYQLQQADEGEQRFLLRLGIIQSALEADAILSTVSEHYPGATLESATDEDETAIAEATVTQRVIDKAATDAALSEAAGLCAAVGDERKGDDVAGGRRRGDAEGERGCEGAGRLGHRAPRECGEGAGECVAGCSVGAVPADQVGYRRSAAGSAGNTAVATHSAAEGAGCGLAGFARAPKGIRAEGIRTRDMRARHPRPLHHGVVRRARRMRSGRRREVRLRLRRLRHPFRGCARRGTARDSRRAALAAAGSVGGVAHITATAAGRARQSIGRRDGAR